MFVSFMFKMTLKKNATLNIYIDIRPNDLFLKQVYQKVLRGSQRKKKQATALRRPLVFVCWDLGINFFDCV